jgi:hypothetical protein
MSQTGFTPILNYASGTASAVPLAANLTSSASGAELAVNYADGKLFYKDSGGVVQVMASKATGAIGGATTQVQFNNAGVLGGSANLTFDGTTLTAAGLAGPFNGTVGATTANTGAFTTLSASSTVSGTGFSTYLASPPAIGGTAAAAITGTTVTASTQFSGPGTGLTGTASSLSIGGNAATATSTTTATNVAGGAANQIPYQTGSGATAFITAPTVASTSLTWNGSAFTWGTSGSSVTVSNDTSTASNLYPLFATATSGTVSSVNTSNAKLLYKPSTGEFQASQLNATNGIVVNSNTVSTSYSIPSGSSAMSAGPITVASGQSVTVPTGSRWVIL